VGATVRSVKSRRNQQVAISYGELTVEHEGDRLTLRYRSGSLSRHLDRRRVLTIAHTDRDDTIRIISARPATPSKKKIYEEG
jgi:uncharacterized DUF497 family protein